MTDAQGNESVTTYTAFWLCAADGNRTATSDIARQSTVDSAISLLEHPDRTTHLRAAYSTVGLTAAVDLILWLVADDLADLQTLAADLRQSAFGKVMDLEHAYIGMAAASQYDPTHGPAFLQDKPPKNYLSVYPFTKTPDWYLLPFEQRRELMAIHGQLGKEFPSILTNTVSSFGIADQEFVVALEDDDPSILIKMVQRLRTAEVRRYTQVDTPIFLGLRKSLEDAILDAI